jgi:RNA polymerase sigma factor (sigma-70 family)
MDHDQFRSLLRQVRTGDEEAAACLVRQYEPALRRYVRIHLTDGRLRQLVDATDICQSVLGSFFQRVRAGQFELEKPEHLLKLLASMARNRLVDHIRSQRAARRDPRGPVAGTDALCDVEDRVTPSRIAAGRELLQKVQESLDSEERALLQRRLQGEKWAAISAALGGTTEATRKRLERALRRVEARLELSELVSV